MFRLLFFLCVCCVTGPNGLGAQNDTLPTVNRLEAGVGFGVMDHTVDFTPARDEENLRGNNFGLALRYFDHRFIGVQAELNYVRAGWREELGDTIVGRYERTVDYVEFSILTQISPGRGAFQPLLQAGPYVGLPTGSSEFIPPGFAAPESVLPSYYGAELPRRLNYGAQVGLGLSLRLGAVRVQAEGRYLIGFSNVFKTGETIAAISRRQGIGGRVTLYYAIWDRSER